MSKHAQRRLRAVRGLRPAPRLDELDAMSTADLERIAIGSPGNVTTAEHDTWHSPPSYGTRAHRILIAREQSR